MKIALCSSYVPFVKGGARNIVEWLQDEFRAHGHQVELIYLPQVDAPKIVMSQMMSYRWVDLTDSADRIICFRPPAHVLPHPHKILWFIHHIRVFYDLWDTPYRGFPDDPEHRSLRSLLHRADTAAMGEARKIFTNSKIVSDRIRRFNNLESEVLYPPVWKPERFKSTGFNDEVVYVCRVEHHKRQHLIVEAMRYTKTKVRLRICGVGLNPAYENALHQLIAGLGGRVIFDNRWISEDEKVELLGRCLAAAYLPKDEDSYGYPSVEASHAGKPVITTNDSGGVLELVSDGYNGRVCEPDARALANAMDQLFLDRRATAMMGSRASDRVRDMNISWAHVVERLLA